MLAALAAALVLQTTVSQFFVGGRLALDLVLVAVVYAALAAGPAAGLIAGTIGGLLQDALSGGIIGIGGLAKTVVGFLVGLVGAQFILSSAVPRFVVFVLATVVHAACLHGVYALLGGARAAALPYGEIALQGVANGVVGLVVFQLVEALPGRLERRRADRAYGRHPLR
jgi:rod shape-determining protein MreD